MAEPGPAHGLLAGKTVLVTAAAGTGIGYATARRCAQEGATVAISDRHERRLGEAAGRLADETGRKPLAVGCDGTAQQQVDHLIEVVAAELGRIDVLVNNVGPAGPASSSTTRRSSAGARRRGRPTTPRRRPASWR
jgi:3-oxoacyl-[acyl-carrier protein] reductase